MLRSTIAILVIAAAPLNVEAKDIVAAAACAEKLNVGARQIYDLTAPNVKQSVVIKDIMIAKIKPLVMAGTLDRNQAKLDAPKAAACLKLLQ